jgi:hypothetical protein
MEDRGGANRGGAVSGSRLSHIESLSGSPRQQPKSKCEMMR